MMKKYLFVITGVILLSYGFLFCAEGAVIKVTEYDGSSLVISSASPGGAPPAVGMKLQEGDRIVTKKDAYVVFYFDKKENIVRVEEESDVVLKVGSGDNELELVNGAIYTLLKRLPRGSTFKVQTPCAVCGVRGTGWKTATDGKATDVSVFGGSVFLRGINKDGSAMEKEFTVKKGYSRSVKKFEAPGKAQKIPKDALKEYRKKMGGAKKSSDRTGSKIKMLDKRDSIRDDRRETLQEKKDDSRLDDIRDKKDDSSDDYHGRKYEIM